MHTILHLSSSYLCYCGGICHGVKYGKPFRICCVVVSDVCVTVICMCGGVCICTVICEHSPPLVHHSPPLAHHKPSLVHHSPPLAHHKPSDNNFITVLQHTITSPYIPLPLCLTQPHSRVHVYRMYVVCVTIVFYV